MNLTLFKIDTTSNALRHPELLQDLPLVFPLYFQFYELHSKPNKVNQQDYMINMKQILPLTLMVDGFQIHVQLCI